MKLHSVFVHGMKEQFLLKAMILIIYCFLANVSRSLETGYSDVLPFLKYLFYDTYILFVLLLST